MSYNHKKGRGICLAIMLLGLLFPVLSTQAAPCDIKPLNDPAVIGDFLGNWPQDNCFDSRYKSSDPSGKFLQFTVADQGVLQTRIWVDKQLTNLELRLREEVLNTGSRTDYKDQLKKILDMVQRTMTQFKASVEPDVDNFGRQRWHKNSQFEIQLYADENAEYPINLSDFLEKNCTDTTSCKQARTDFIQIYYFTLDGAHIVGQWYVNTTKKTIIAIEKNAGLWVKYRNEKKSMYLWESAINELLIDVKDEGTRPPPNHQWIFFHPTPSLEYTGGSADSFKPGIALEVFGINGWRWQDGEMKAPFGIPYLKALGVSAIANYSEREGYKRLSYGAMVHFNHHYSLGVTRGKGPDGTETKILLTIDLLKWFEDKSDKVKKFLEFTP